MTTLIHTERLLAHGLANNIFANQWNQLQNHKYNGTMVLKMKGKKLENKTECKHVGHITFIVRIFIVYLKYFYFVNCQNTWVLKLITAER